MHTKKELKWPSLKNILVEIIQGIVIPIARCCVHCYQNGSEIAIDVQEYFNHSLLTHILGCCFYSGLLLLAFNHLGCVLPSLHAHHNKQSSPNRCMSLLNSALLHIAGRWGLMNFSTCLDLSLGTATITETFGGAPRAYPGCFQSSILLGYNQSQNPENQLILGRLLTSPCNYCNEFRMKISKCTLPDEGCGSIGGA